jgi:hypothetical protein
LKELIIKDERCSTHVGRSTVSQRPQSPAGASMGTTCCDFTASSQQSQID